MAADVDGRVVSNSVSIDKLQFVSQRNVVTDVTGGNVQSMCNPDGTFHDFLPLNNDFNRVLTVIGTPDMTRLNVNNVNNGDIFNESQLYQDNSQVSQSSLVSDFVPNQEYIQMLDYKLINLPKDTYIEKLLEVTNNSDDTITWYRSILCKVKSL